MNMRSYSCCQSSSLESSKVSLLSETLKLVSESSRLKILCILRQGDHCVCEMMEHLNLSQSLISHHVRDLKDAGLVADSKQGLRVYYSLTEKGNTLPIYYFKFP